jgi:hypothetical protein
MQQQTSLTILTKMATSNEESVQEMDAQITRAKFSSVIRDSIMTCISEAPTIWKGPNGQDYIYEQSLFEKNTKPIMWGLGCTMICFVSFRLNASRSFQRFRQQYIRPSARSPSIQRTATSPVEQRKELQREMMSQALSVPVDLLLSILIGASATAFLTDWTQVQRDLQRVPGLPGKSVLADTMCPALLELHMNTPTQVWHAPKQDETLQLFQQLVQKCKQRAKVQEDERQRRGLSDNEPISIPFPGFL